MATENLQVPDIQASQNQKEVTANAAHNLLDRAMNGDGTLQKVITGSTSFTATEIRERPITELTGTPGAPFNVNMPDTNRRWYMVVNNTDDVATIQNSVGGGTGKPVIGVGDASSFYYDGVNFLEVVTAAAVTFLELTDTPGSYSGAALQTLRINSGATGVEFADVAVSGGAPGFLTRNELLHVRDEKVVNTDGGTSVSSTWNQRDLNTVLDNEISGASVSSDQIVLPAGTYYIEAAAPVNGADRHKLRLRNITDGATEVLGGSFHTANTDNQTPVAVLAGRFAITATKTFQLQHFTQNGITTIGMGVATDATEIEVYADVRIWRDPGASQKSPVRVATAVNGTLATAFENGDTIDGITLATDDRILIKDQSAAAENGIYTVNATGAPTRAPDFDDDSDLGLGVLISVLLGDTNARSIWMHTAGLTIAGAKTFLKTEPAIGYTPLPLGGLRDVVANEIGQPLDDTTTPAFERINGATDKGLRVFWAASNSDEVAFAEVYMPPDFDSDKDITIHLVAEMSGATDAPTIDVQVFDSSGDTEMGDATATITDTRAEKIVTITAANLTGHPLGWLSISLVPGAHTTDTLAVFSAWIEYTRKVA